MEYHFKRPPPLYEGRINMFPQTGSCMWNKKFLVKVLHYLVLSLLEMYSVKPYYEDDVAISVPSNMYKLKNLHQAEKGVSLTVRKSAFTIFGIWWCYNLIA